MKEAIYLCYPLFTIVYEKLTTESKVEFRASLTLLNPYFDG